MATFRNFKNESSLTTYSRTAKELLAYYYRVVYRQDGHFTREAEDQVLPRDVIEPTRLQRHAMSDIVGALGAVKKAVKDAGGCDDEEDRVAPLSGSGDGKGRGRKAEVRGLVWAEPKNFTNHNSAIVWIMQLLVFDYACFYKQDEKDGILDCIRLMVENAFSVKEETPFGHALAWRNYLGTVGKSAVTRHQARWSQDGQTLTLNGVTLHMDHVPQLLMPEYRQAHRLLFDELLFGADDIAPVESWRVHDDLDLEEYGGSWLTDKRNTEVLPGVQDALLRQIQSRAGLRQVFVRDGPAGQKVLCRKAIAIYEAHVQEFLQRLVTLIHAPPCPPAPSQPLLQPPGLHGQNK
ncbi:hypothetical protein Purlil1_12541 [Purpureocillium lilacinum]|uniref:Uncharacterized protein n=1 Tax=Purpureocillium lilacinum TaxID=33203 RepID=A0ABR0BGK1_PURLI|nr:hypothetical protein Purlil1_12541 [Purpureocillium lilacinum]